MKSIIRKGGGVKVWTAGYEMIDTSPELSLVTASAQDGPVAKTMLHTDENLSRKLKHIKTSFSYKTIFPESHTFQKLVLLVYIQPGADDTFGFEDLFELVKEELNYLDESRITEETTYILSIGQEVKFIQKDENRPGRYRIIAEGKKTDTKEAGLKKKWVDFSIKKDCEQEIDTEINELREKYTEKRSQRRTLTDFT